MKSKYIKIFMIFAVMFAMLSALLVTPKAAYAKGSEAEIEYDLNAIKASIPSTAILSFPVPYQSVYGNEINWTVQEGQYVITYDKDAHWMVVDRSKVQGESQTITITVNVEGTTNTFEVKVPAGETAVPSYTYTLNYGYEGKESKTKDYKLGQASITLEQPTRDNYRFDGWFDANGKKYEKILVGSMSNISLTAKWTELAVESITLDITNVQTSYKGGDDLVTTGLVVKALWNNGETTDVTSGFECNPVVVNYNTTGEVVVTVTYQGKSATYTVDVSQNENSITGLSIEGWTYGDEANAPTAKALYGQMKFLYSDSENGVYTETVPTNAGTYFVKAVVEAAEDANYKGAESLPVEFEISKKALTLSTNAQTVSIKDIANLKWEFTSNDFEGEDKLTEEVLANLVVKYYQNGVEATPMAGQTYDVRFSGLTMPNYNITINDSTLTVNTEELYFEYENFEGIVYDAENHMFTVKAYAEAGEVDIEITDATIVITLNDQEFTGAVNAGTYNVTISIDSPTYGSHTETKSFVIAKAQNEVSIELEGWTYGKTANEPTINKLAGDATVEYYQNGSETPLEGKPSNAGNYTVKVTVAESDNYEGGTDTAEFTIAKASQNLTVSIDSWKYNEPKEPTCTGANGEVTYKYYVKETNEELTEKPSNVGSYYVVATAAETTNYNAAEATDEFTISKGQEEITDLVLAGWTYGDDANEPTANSKFGTVVFTYYVKESGTKLDSKPENAGSYYVKATVEGTVNYDGDEEQLDFTIARLKLENKDVTVTVLGSDWNTSVPSTLTPGVTVTYNGQEITSHNAPTYAYADETKIGTATVSVELTGNYEGTLTAEFEVTEYGQAGIDAEELPEPIDEEYLLNNKLPVELGEGIVKSIVLWSSENTAVSVNPLTGEVTLNKAPLTEDITVTLVATVNYGTTSSFQKTYVVTLTKETVIEEQVHEVTGIIANNATSNLTVETKDVNEYTITDIQNNKLAAYDINFEQAVTGSITISIPIPTGYDDADLYVYHIVDGQSIDMNATKVNGYLVFESDSFSPYVVVVKTHTVTFVTGENASAVDEQVVEDHKKAEKPADPTRDGYTFKGWFIGDVEFDFDTNITSDVEIEAKWEEILNEPEYEYYTVTLNFDDVAKRTEFNSSIQVWEENGIKVTNNKASSTSNIADYVKPARFYKSSNLVVEATGITKIVFDCNTTAYATALKSSIGAVDGVSATVESDKVILVFNTAVDSFTIAKFSDQVRMDSITVTYQVIKHDHEFGETWTVDKEATCVEKGSESRHCTVDGCNETTDQRDIEATGHSIIIDKAVNPTCNNTGLTEGSHCDVCDAILVAQQEIEATGHHFVDGVCDVCGENESPNPDTPTLTEKTYEYEFTSSQFSANGTKTLNNINWTLAGDGGYWGYDGSKGQHLGSGSKPYKSLTLTSEELKKVSKIVINTSGGSSINASFTITVGGKQVGDSRKLTTTPTSYTFETNDPLDGEIVITYTQTSSKAIYIKSISVTYAE